jgi:hypothetical protein
LDERQPRHIDQDNDRGKTGRHGVEIHLEIPCVVHAEWFLLEMIGSHTHTHITPPSKSQAEAERERGREGAVGKRRQFGSGTEWLGSLKLPARSGICGV